MKWPRIRSRRTTKVSPWMSIVAREVEFSRGEKPQIYHAVEQADYIAIVALTQGGKNPLVRQYRPALEAFSGNCQRAWSILEEVRPTRVAASCLKKPG